MLEIYLRAALKRTQSLEAERTEVNCAWRRYNRKKRRIKTTHIRSNTKWTEPLEAEFTEGKWAWKRYNRERERMETPEQWHKHDQTPGSRIHCGQPCMAKMQQDKKGG
jgi:hypothetical protein